MNSVNETGLYAELNQRLGVSLADELLEHAFTHRSFAYENGGLPTNERLEFLGDSVLGVIVTESLFRNHPSLSEGRLAKLRAAVVNMRALAGVARELKLGKYLRLGRGEEATGGRDKSSILADTLEALFGAVYLEHGVDVARSTVHRLVDPLLESSANLGAGLDWKTSLQELTASASLGVPEYQITEEGPDHAKLFHAVAVVGGLERGTGSGRSKKEAEQTAAAAAFETLTAQIAPVQDDVAAAGQAALAAGDGKVPGNARRRIPAEEALPGNGSRATGKPTGDGTGPGRPKPG